MRISPTVLLENATADGYSAVMNLSTHRWSIMTYGTWGTALVDIELSHDGVNWVTGVTLSADGYNNVTNGSQPVVARYARAHIYNTSTSSVTCIISQEEI